MSHPAVVTFTARGPELILAEQGSQAWRLDPPRAREAEFLVCTQNRNQGDWGHASEPHGEGFLIGRISEVVPSAEHLGRWIIKISEYARISVPKAWGGWRYPVHYTTLEELGIDPTTLSFKPIPTRPDESTPQSLPVEDDDMEIRPLSIAEAKIGLAAFFKVSPDAIKITIEA